MQHHRLPFIVANIAKDTQSQIFNTWESLAEEFGTEINLSNPATWKDDEVKSQDQSRDAEIMMVMPSDKPDDESSTVLQDVPASATGNSRPGEELESESIADEQCIEEGAAEEQ
ncbi:hypothetical protein ACLKA6_017743, partial [Drosophila palustris]